MRYLVILILFCSCFTPKKADKRLGKINKQYPEKVSKMCSIEYPCIPRKADTIEKVYYDLIEVECPDGQIPITNKDSSDTVLIIKYIEKRVVKEIRIPCESKVITQYLEDTAKVSDLSNRLAKSDEAYQIAKAKAKKSTKFNWILAAILALLVLVLYLRGRK